MKRESRPTASTPLLTLWNWEGVETVWWFVKCHPEPEQSQSSRRRKFPPGKNFTNHIHSKLISFQLLRPYHQIIIFSNDEHRIIAKSEMRTQHIQYFWKATVQLCNLKKVFCIVVRCTSETDAFLESKSPSFGVQRATLDIWHRHHMSINHPTAAEWNYLIGIVSSLVRVFRVINGHLCGRS